MATVNGTSGNDNLNGTSANDTLNGLGGSDTLIGSGGTDFYDGGTGSDTLDLRASAAGVTVSFAAGTISGGFNGTFVDVERVLGSNVADSLIGAAGGQNLSARGGNDTLAGGAGVDTLWGGGGADSFVFRETGTANADRVSDFASGLDKIVLDASVMTALGASGNFAAGDSRFVANSTGTAQDGNDRVVFNTTTKQLFYDADGNGSGAAVLIATLQSTATVAAPDIVVEGGSSGQVINGTAGNDSLVGGPGDDTINGFGGLDTLHGLDGKDSLNGGDDSDVLDGGDGDDTLIGGEGEGTYHGGAGNDSIVGGSADEEFFPGEGNDRVETGGGLNVVYVGPVLAGVDESVEYGNDTLVGGASSDRLNFYLRSAVSVDMPAGTLSGGSQSGGGGITFSDFESFGFWGDYSVHFTAADTGVSVFANGAGDDTLIGGDGNDRFFGGGGQNLFIGGEGADTMSSRTGQAVSTFVFNTAPAAGSADTIFAFVTGIDSLHFDASVFTALGAGGNFSADDERFYGAPGANQGHDPTDRLIYNSSNGDLWYDADGNGPGAALLVANLPRDNGEGDPWTVAATDIWVDAPAGQTINGTSGSDTLQGGAGNDTLNGLGGGDTLVASGGTDFYDGGTGIDTLDVRATMTGVAVSFASGTISGGFSGTFANIERVLGGNGADSLLGAAGGQNLSSRMGDDTLAGGAGVDTLWGGGGADTFVFREMGTANADRISDFATGSDKLHLDDAAFTAIGAMGNFAAGDGRFVANSNGTAQDAGDRVVFNISTGQLYYDADGSGSGGSQLIATVQSGATVAATDIVVI